MAGVAVEVRGLDKLQRYLGRFDKTLRDGLLRAMKQTAAVVERHVKSAKLSGQVLRVRSGRLRSSIIGRAEQRGTEIIGVVGSNVIYARIHELGGRAGRGHRTIIPARPYLKPAMEEKREEILKLIDSAVHTAVESGES